MLDEKIPFIENCSKGFSVVLTLKFESIANYFDSYLMIKDVSNTLHKGLYFDPSSIDTIPSLKKKASSNPSF